MGLFDKPEDIGRTHRLEQLEARVLQLETTLAMLTHQRGQAVPAAPAVGGLPADTLVRVQSLKQQGKFVQAVKAYRDATGAGLKEAKDAVDAL